MLKTELLEIIANGENSGVEFKRDDIRAESLAREIVAMANLRGGMVLLGVLAKGPHAFGSPEEAQAQYRKWLEGGSLYWHMVDLLWIFIFSLLYLLGAR